MADKTVTVTGPSSSATVTYNQATYFCDTTRNPFNVLVGCVASSTGTTAYNIEYTLDYTGSSAFVSSAATWFSSLASALSTSGSVQFTVPATAIRLNVTTQTAAGTVAVSFQQAGVS